MSRSITKAGNKAKVQKSTLKSSRSRTASRLALGLAMGIVVAELSPAAMGQATWVGDTSTDWNNAANWSSDPNPPTGNITINTNTPNVATITADSTLNPVDIFLANGAGTTAQINHTAGTNRTGNGNWAFVGINGGIGTYNLTGGVPVAPGTNATGFNQGTGSFNVGNGTGGRLSIGGSQFNAAGTGTFNMNTSGTLTARDGLSISIAEIGGATGTFNLDNGTVNGDGEMWVGGSGAGTMNQTGGTANIGSWLVVGRNGGGTGTYNLSGGTVNASTLNDRFTSIGATAATATGTINVTGGTFNGKRIYVGEQGNGTLNVSGTGLVTATQTTEGVRLGAVTGGVGTVNLNGGTIQTPVVTKGPGTGTFNFNGGTLTAAGNSATFMTGLTRANVRNGGAFINSNGSDITIGQALVHSDIAGDTAIDGGVTKNGAGALTLTGSNTYTGNTTVSGGSLVVGGAGDLNTSAGINVNGAGAKFVSTSSVAVSPIVSVVSGGVDGTGTINTVNVASSATNTISNGNGGTGTLTIGTLDLSGAADFKLNVGGTSPVLATTTLNTNGSGNAVIDATNSLWTPGTYNLISYNTLGGSGFGAFAKGTIAGLSGRQSATLTNPAGFISLVIAGDNPRWTGALSNEWSTATLANPKNWQLITSGTPTDYIQGDVVLFDDNATTTNPTISVANVSPSSVQFNNSTKNYTLSGAFGIAGTAGVTKNGTGALTITNANTHSGGTVLNAGQLNINNANALGSGTLTVASGATIDNTSGAPITVATNNAQQWIGDFTFGATNALNMGTGAIGRSGNTTITVNGTAAPVTLNGAIGGTGDFVKAGTGSLVIGNTSNTYTGATNVTAGTLSVPGSITTAAATNVNGGNLVVSGTVTAPVTNINSGAVVINSGGTLTTSTGDTWVANNGATATVDINNGGTLSGNTVLVGGNGTTGGTGTATVAAGGTLNTKNWLVIGFANGGVGTLNVNGGTVNIRKNDTFGNLELSTWDAATSGTVNLNSGSLNLLSNAQIVQGVMGNNSGSSTFNQNGGNVTFYSDQGTTVGGTGNTIVGNAGTGTHTYNLNGGTLSTGSVVHNAGTGTLNLNGGILKATRNDAVLINNLSSVNVGVGGAIIDTNGNNVSANKPLLHNTAGPATDGGLTKNGAGTFRIGGGESTYTGNTVINGGTLQLPLGAPPVAVGVYSFDDVRDTADNPVTSGPLGPGYVVNNSGTGTGMNGTVNHANHLLDPNNGSANLIPGRFGNALELDGLGSSVDIASRIVDQAGNGSWTLSTWVKTATPGSSMLSKNDANNGWNNGDSIFYLGANPIAPGGGGLPTGVRNAGGFIQGTAPVNDDAWHMVTYVSNEGAKFVYVDGVAVPLSQAAFNNADPTTRVRLGFTINEVAGDGSAHFAGALDEMKFFTGALSASQVASLFATNTLAGAGQQYLPATTAVSIPMSGAALDINGNDQTIGSLSGVAGSSVALGAGTLTTGGTNASTTFAGQISGSTGGLTKTGTGTMHLTGAVNSFGGAATVNGGTLEVSSGGGSKRVLKAGSVLTTGNGRIDLKDNKLVTDMPVGTFDGTTYSGVQGEVAKAYNFGSWDQPGLMTSMPDAGPLIGTTTIGVATAEQVLFIAPTETATAFGQTVTGATTLAMYTYAGDMNFDGLVDAADYGVIDNWVQFPGTDGYANGDLNYDGVIDAGDYGIIDNTIQLQGAPIPGVFDTYPAEGGIAAAAASGGGLSGVTAVPEPASLSIVGLAAASLLGRRRRQRDLRLA